MRRSYVIGHWIITLLLAPFTSQAILYIFGKSPHQIVGLLEVYPITFLFSLVFSIPTFVIYLLTFYFLSKHNVKLTIAKTILIAISVLGVFITILIIQGIRSLDIAFAYSITCLVVGLLLKLKAVNLKV